MASPDSHTSRIVNRGLRKVLPRSLLGRSLLMILLPLVLLQAVALQMFYGSHLDIVSRRLSSGVVGEIANTVELLRRFPDPADRNQSCYNPCVHMIGENRLDQSLAVAYKGCYAPRLCVCGVEDGSATGSGVDGTERHTGSRLERSHH